MTSREFLRGCIAKNEANHQLDHFVTRYRDQDPTRDSDRNSNRHLEFVDMGLAALGNGKAYWPAKSSLGAVAHPHGIAAAIASAEIVCCKCESNETRTAEIYDRMHRARRQIRRQR